MLLYIIIQQQLYFLIGGMELKQFFSGQKQGCFFATAGGAMAIIVGRYVIVMMLLPNLVFLLVRIEIQFQWLSSKQHVKGMRENDDEIEYT